MQASRTRQGELSTVLGEQVRQAVELILTEVDKAKRRDPALLDVVRKVPGGSELPQKRILEALYQAASRLVMRMVIVLYSEARGMLPRNLESYNASYGLEGLFERLRRAVAHEGFQALTEQSAAWPRILSLFRLIYDGCPHPDFPVHAYGGLLFRPGNPNDTDPIMRALAVMEDPRVEPSDAAVLEILQRLKIGKIKIRHGRSATWVSGPVDFTDLRTEYIGIMYEGLLDYELKATDQTMVFLNIGQQPILPLEILENMPDANLKDLLQKLSKEKAKGPQAEESGNEEGEEEVEEEGTADDDTEKAEEAEIADVEEEESVVEEEESSPDTRTEADIRRERAHQWALRAVEVAGWIKKPRGKKPNLYQYEKDRQAAARRLISRVLDQGEFYLARWGGTRKGSGTFYTKPGLAVPTVHRTLEPLAYIKTDDGKLIPRTPEEILALKVCDPACGSASFLVAALNYLTAALYQSLLYHHRISEKETQTVITLPYGRESKAGIPEEILPVPTSDERFEKMLKARLKRYVVEQCIYGVDFNPMAVELARLSLWLETMDEQLPFGFLDHKIKVGNSLVGCWFDRFMDYPLCAWLREGGDKNHTRAVHYAKGEWTKKIKEVLNESVKPELLHQIAAQMKDVFQFVREGAAPDNLHQEAVKAFDELHSLPVATPDGIEQRERLYREHFTNNPKFNALRNAFDTWCAVWFWPADRLGEEAPTPANFYMPKTETREIVHQLRDELRFFHWELEFPDVFATTNGGFDAVLGNPPWDIAKPKSQEFFSNFDPIFRTYSKQDALNVQKQLFDSSSDIEREWLSYSAHFKAMSCWTKCVGAPFGDPDDDAGTNVTLARGVRNYTLHSDWRSRRLKRKGFIDPAHPFLYQGSADINTYKMFLEVSHAILKTGGHLGMIVPSGLCTDKGTTALRKLFLDQCRWEWIIGFINWEKIFNIYYRFKFAVIILQKGRRSDRVRTAFGRYKIGDLETINSIALEMPATSIDQFSPYSKALLEPRTHRDLEIIERIYDRAVLLGDQSDDGWQIQYAREFDMTNDSKLFSPRPRWEAQGYRPDAYGRWLRGGWKPASQLPKEGIHAQIAGRSLKLERGMIPSVDGTSFIAEQDVEGIALPVYEGRMIGQFDFSEKGWMSGKGRTAKWREIPFEEKVLEPQYLMSLNTFEDSEGIQGTKVGFLAIASATNARSAICALIDGFPCGNSVPLLRSSRSPQHTIELTTILNSYAFDYPLRCRLGGINLNYFILEETPLLAADDFQVLGILFQHAVRLSWTHRRFSQHWLSLSKAEELGNPRWSFPKLWAITSHERLRLRSILNALVAERYGLTLEDYTWMLRFDPNDPKGFWRVDHDGPLELRHTTMALAAFRDLKEMELEAFCDIPDPDGLPGCGWQIPDTLTFAVRDGGIIEFGAKDGQTYPVRERLGPRFLPWQLEGTPEESWAECELHARNILGKNRFDRLMAELRGEVQPLEEAKKLALVEDPTGQGKLFATGAPNLLGQDDDRLFDKKKR